MTSCCVPLTGRRPLPATLRQIGVADLLLPHGLDFESYGTARMMAGSAKQARQIIGNIDPVGGAKKSPVLLECLPPAAVAELDAVGLSLGEADDSTVSMSIGVLKQAWQVVDTVWPGLSSSVRYLVRCVHLLKAPSPELDCSYSRPDLPFSVFLSVPDHGTRARIERVTEALVHETMHLQLSLVERRIPLVELGRPETVAFSPWRGSERNIRGVLHALYVFVVARTLWQRAARTTPCGLGPGIRRGARSRHPRRSRENPTPGRIPRAIAGRSAARAPVVGARRRISRSLASLNTAQVA